MSRIQVIDSHTGGEPTRVIVSGGPDLGEGPLAERRQRFRDEFDHIRSAVVNEPRGSDVMVGALLVPPHDDRCMAGVIFFNNVSVLNMCGHGTIGVVETLAYLGRIGPGVQHLETPVGMVSVEYHGNHRVSFENVPSYRFAANMALHLATGQIVHGDIAWGGNWFFLCHDHGQALSHERTEELTAFAWEIRQQLARRGVTGANGAEIDHVELVAPPSNPSLANSQNFVLCPGKAYDRSPCGTGTSAHLACLAADGRLAPGELWRQQSVLGSEFEGTYRLDEQGRCIPRITGTAYVTSEATLILDPGDPFCSGIRR
jgi:4-hydroxyproline epimerase